MSKKVTKQQPAATKTVMPLLDSLTQPRTMLTIMVSLLFIAVTLLALAQTQERASRNGSSYSLSSSTAQEVLKDDSFDLNEAKLPDGWYSVNNADTGAMIVNTGDEPKPGTAQCFVMVKPADAAMQKIEATRALNQIYNDTTKAMAENKGFSSARQTDELITIRTKKGDRQIKSAVVISTTPGPDAQQVISSYATYRSGPKLVTITRNCLNTTTLELTLPALKAITFKE